MKKGIEGFGLIIAIIIAVVVIITSVIYVIPRITETSFLGIKIAESPASDYGGVDLAINNNSDINCTNNMAIVHNYGEKDARNVEIKINGNIRTVDLPAGAALPIPFNNTPVTIEINPDKKIKEVNYDNNNASKC